MPPFVETFRALPARSKGIIAVSAVAILAIAFLLLRVAGAPSYTMLSSGLDPAQTGKVTAALDEQGIGYELRNNGTALAVEKSQVAQARVALAGSGVSLDAGGGEGFELFDKQKLGASDFQLQVTYQRALEGEIARTIGSVQGVSSPQVQLVLPEDDLFADEATPGHGRGHARQLGRHARAGRHARHRAARRLVREGPQDRERHDHRRVGRARVAGRRRLGRRRRVRRQAGARGALLARHGGRPQRAARPHARRRARPRCR